MEIEAYKKQFEHMALPEQGGMARVRRDSFERFRELGIPGPRHEEWKYSRVRPVFQQHQDFAAPGKESLTDPASWRLPGSAEANELVIQQGRYLEGASRIISPGLQVMNMEQAFEDPRFHDLLAAHYNHVGTYLNDGLASLNTALSWGGLFIGVEEGARIAEPIYVYYIQEASAEGGFAQPRCFVHLPKQSSLTMITRNLGGSGFSTLSNQVLEALVDDGARFSLYQLQDDHSQASAVNTVHIRQVAPSEVTSVVLSLSGRMVRNNLHMLMEASGAESHLYGLYVLDEETHVDHHTVADHIAPHCQSNELYKGVLDAQSTGVFNGKIFVRPQAQKTNAFQSNRNVLLSPQAQINAKPQLEIFADDVKCSHGCTVGRLDEEALYYMQSRGIPAAAARALLLQGYAEEVLEKVEVPALKSYMEERIQKRLNP